MSVQEIAARLDDRFGLLTSGNRTALMRHKTLCATIDWSHELLSPAERVLLRRLAVFAGGWALDAAEAVCVADPLERSEVLRLLMRLIDQSLVNADTDAGRTRYRFLQTVRAYATERLEAADETADVQARHRQWCLAFVERAAAGLKGPDRSKWVALVAAEHDNIRAALDSCALEPSAAGMQLRLAAAMGQYWFPMQPGEGRRQLAAALERAGTTPSAARAGALNWLALFELLYGDPSIARELARAALTDARALVNERVAAEALLALAQATTEDDDAGRIKLLEEGLALARVAEDAGLLARYLGVVAATAAESGDLQRARTLLKEGSAVGSAAGPPLSLVTTSAQLG
jgi:non-specific serine/threonine protein kinase